MNLSIAHVELIIRKPEVVFEPLQKRRLEDSPPPIKSVAGEPYQFRLAKAEAAHVLQLHLQFFDVNSVGDPNVGMPVMQRKLHARCGEMLPDELEHEELVKISVQQRTNDGIEFPVVVVRAFSEVDDHRCRAVLTDSLEDNVKIRAKSLTQPVPAFTQCSAPSFRLFPRRLPRPAAARPGHCRRC